MNEDKRWCMKLEKQEKRRRTTSDKYSFHFIYKFISFVYISFSMELELEMMQRQWESAIKRWPNIWASKSVDGEQRRRRRKEKFAVEGSLTRWVEWVKNYLCSSSQEKSQRSDNRPKSRWAGRALIRFNESRWGRGSPSRNFRGVDNWLINCDIEVKDFSLLLSVRTSSSSSGTGDVASAKKGGNKLMTKQVSWEMMLIFNALNYRLVLDTTTVTYFIINKSNGSEWTRGWNDDYAE
jgi:hypothetical protein